MKRLLALSLVTIAGCHTARSTTPVTPNDTLVQLASHRAQIIGWLHDYREAGEFPTDAAGRPMSAFVDARGVRCPMAELIHKSGRDDLVEAVAREANTVRLADVHDGPLHDWMLASGLTQEEISLVQGAMNISMDWIQNESETVQLAAAKAEVRGKLEVAEMVLRDATATSLVTSANRLPANQRPATLAFAPIRGAVVPKTAVPRVPAETPIAIGQRPLRFRTFVPRN